MSIPNIAQYAVFVVALLLCARPLGVYMANVFEGKRTFLDPVMRPAERLVYRALGTSPENEMTWKRYALSFILFGLVGALLLYAILRLQTLLPFYDPQSVNTTITPDLAVNVAVSFATTTTWQAYGGETTMSYFTQMVGLTAQNFLAGAAGLAVGVAFIRGFVRENSRTIGNFWVDLTRSLLWILLPMSFVGALFLAWQGVPMNFGPYTNVSGVENGSPQTIAQGPVAAMESIKNLGTNGGGFFNVNAAHPYENPNPLTNFVELLFIMVIPAGLVVSFGRMTGRPREGRALLNVMVALLVAGFLICGYFEQGGNPMLGDDIEMGAGAAQSGGNMEGKETRFGVGGSSLAAIVTSNGATGSYNSMHDSYMPASGGLLLFNMLLGEVVFGGLGTGLYSIVMISLVALFMAGLMVGRKPQYIGKEIEAREMRLVMLYALASPLAVLSLSAVAVVSSGGLSGLTTNAGAHGFTEIVYAYASSFANNGQNFAGLSANSVFYNTTTAFAMLAGRFALAIPVLALAGILASKRTRATVSTVLPTNTITFEALVIGTIIVVGGLSYFPLMALGPIVEQLIVGAGTG